VQADLADCGIGTNILTQESQEYLAPGPEGPVFGRRFQMAQFAWAAWEPPALSASMNPGPYPDYPGLGWGERQQYTNRERPGLPGWRFTVERPMPRLIFSAGNPVGAAIPLYWHFKTVLGQPDF
jgi:hypothetical protein